MAGLMAKGGQTVQWTTPLGLQVKQDYYENKKEKRIDSQLTRFVIYSKVFEVLEIFLKLYDT